MLFLAADPDVSAEIADVAWKAAVGIGVANLIAGALVLVAWYAVQRRFLQHEYPGDLQRITGAITHLETSLRAEMASVRGDIQSLRTEVGAARTTVVEHAVVIGEHGRRIGRVENRLDRDPLDDTHGAPRRR